MHPCSDGIIACREGLQVSVLVLTLVDELLKGFLQSIAELLIFLEGLVQHGVQLQLHLEER